MTRRASLPGADELFRSTSPSLSSVKQPDVEPAKPLVAPAISAPVHHLKKVFVLFNVDA